MSIKTLRKRIALVAVSALGAGFMTVIAVPSANATLAAGEMTVYANNSAGSAADVVTDATATNGYSQGLLTQSTTGAAIGGANQLTQTATVRLDGGVAVGFLPTSGKFATIGVVGGTITEAQTASSSATAIISVGGTGAYSYGANTSTGNARLAVVVKPSAVGTMVIAAYSGDSAGATTTLTAKVTVTVVASGAAYGKVSAANTTVYWGTAGSATSDTSTTDVASTNSSKENQGVARGTIVLYDAYDNEVATSTGLITCTVTGGGVCNLSTSTSPSAGDGATDFQTHTASTIYYSVAQGTANAPAKGSVTIKYNDEVLATKSYTIKGTVAKLIVSNVGIGRTGTNSANNFYYTAQDSAGNTVYLSNGTTVITARPSTLNEAVTAARITTAESASALGKGDFTCSGTAGYGITVDNSKANLQMRVADATGTYVYSNVFEARCGGDAKAFTASLDKATYAPGEVATLTFSFTDTKGNKANDFYLLTADSDSSGDATKVLTYVGAPGTVVTAAASTDKPLAGVKTYKFIVGTTEGNFNMVADAPYVRAQNIALGGSQAAITIPYTIKASTTAVTNAEVLAAIVKLIASINKQIRALQKSLKR